jgi:hypothetical protein
METYSQTQLRQRAPQPAKEKPPEPVKRLAGETTRECVKRLWMAGTPSMEIANLIGYSDPSAVTGMARRMKLTARKKGGK